MIRNSLIDDYIYACVRLHKVTADDGYGGEITSWTEGAHVDVAFAFDGSTQARIAQAQGVENRYVITVDKSVSLEYHDVFRRSDGKIFRVTSSGSDNKTPDSSVIDIRQAEAEEWTLPDALEVNHA